MKRWSWVLIGSFLAGAAQARPPSGLGPRDFDGKISGARYAGLGEAAVALDGMADSPLWNPAALDDVKEPVVSMDVDVARQSRLAKEVVQNPLSLRGRQLTYFGLVTEGKGMYFRPLAAYTKRDPDTTDPVTATRETQVSINQFGLSQSRRVDATTRIGINLSYLNAHNALLDIKPGEADQVTLGDGHGVILDWGVQIKKEGLTLGLAGFNLPGFLFWNTYRTDTLPIVIRGGVALRPVAFFVLSTEYEKRWYRGGVKQPGVMHVGMEMTPLTWCQVRAGLSGEDLNNSDQTVYHTGFSILSPQRQRLDFALRQYRLEDQSVRQYLLSVVWPFPMGKN